MPIFNRLPYPWVTLGKQEKEKREKGRTRKTRRPCVHSLGEGAEITLVGVILTFPGVGLSFGGLS